MTLRIRETSDKIIVYLPDAKMLDETRIQEVSDLLLSACAQQANSAKKFVIDFGVVQFMTSAVLSKLLQVAKQAKQHSVDLRLAHVGHSIQDVFHITKLTKLFRIDDDDDDEPEDFTSSFSSPSKA